MSPEATIGGSDNLHRTHPKPNLERQERRLLNKPPGEVGVHERRFECLGAGPTNDQLVPVPVFQSLHHEQARIADGIEYSSFGLDRSGLDTRRRGSFGCSNEAGIGGRLFDESKSQVPSAD